MNSCYWNPAEQRFQLPERDLEPPDARLTYEDEDEEEDEEEDGDNGSKDHAV